MERRPTPRETLTQKTLLTSPPLVTLRLESLVVSCKVLSRHTLVCLGFVCMVLIVFETMEYGSYRVIGVRSVVDVIIDVKINSSIN
jgi:hypothetical protein